MDDPCKLTPETRYEFNGGTNKWRWCRLRALRLNFSTFIKTK